MFMRAGVLTLGVLLAFQAVAETLATEQTSVTCDAFRRDEDGQKWVVLWPIVITIRGEPVNLSNDSPISRGTLLDGVDVAGVLEEICYGQNPHDVKTEDWPRHHRRGRR